MKTATVRELRNNFSKISGWLESGEKVEVTKRGLPYAKIELTSPAQRTKHVSQMTVKERQAFFRKRFGAAHRRRMKEIFGDKILPGNGVLRMRESGKW